MTQEQNEEYLGDGLYASFDGYQICLRAPRGTFNPTVYLDDHALSNFMAYVARLQEQWRQRA